MEVKETENKEMETEATNIMRFATLLLISAGIFAGLGTHFFLDYLGTGVTAEWAIGAFMVVIVVVAIAWCDLIMPNPSAVAKLMTLLIFVSALFVGLGASILVGFTGSQLLLVLLFAIVLVYGIWIFRNRNE